jgi:ribosomal protein S18 acetylase RimI-like enzyme
MNNKKTYEVCKSCNSEMWYITPTDVPPVGLVCEKCREVTIIDDWLSELELDENDLIIEASLNPKHPGCEQYKPKYRCHFVGPGEIDDVWSIYAARETLGGPLDYSKELLEVYIPTRQNLLGVYAAENSKLVGFTLFFDHIIWAYIDIFCIAPTAKRSRAGSFLMKMLTNWGKVKNWKVLECCTEKINEPVVRFMMHQGFEYLGNFDYRYKFIDGKASLNDKKDILGIELEEPPI